MTLKLNKFQSSNLFSIMYDACIAEQYIKAIMNDKRLLVLNYLIFNGLLHLVILCEHTN